MIGFAAHRLMELETEARCGAAHGERSPDRKIQRNGHRQLVGLRSQWRAISTACPWLRRTGDAGDLGPNLEGSGPGGSILGGWNSVVAKQEEVVDPFVGGQEALRLPGRLEALHLPLSSSRGLVRVLCPVVQPLMLPVLDRGHHLALGSPVTRQLVASVVAIRPRPSEPRGG